MNKAVVLLSGGLDSCVALAIAVSEQKMCYALSFDYGQRHICELEYARKIADHYGVEHTVIKVDPALFGTCSSLLNNSLAIEDNTVVPGRNLLFLSSAATFAEAIDADEIYFGANKDDIETYPDCRREFIESTRNTISLSSNTPIEIISPLATCTKPEIIALGHELQAPIAMSWSCYDPQEGAPCQKCPACLLRKSSFPP